MRGIWDKGGNNEKEGFGSSNHLEAHIIPIAPQAFVQIVDDSLQCSIVI